VTILDRTTLHPPVSNPLSITSATVEVHPTLVTSMVHVLGTGFDVTLVPVLYDAGTAVTEAPFFIIVSPTELWITIPGTIPTPVSVDLLRPLGDPASARIGGPTPSPCSPPILVGVDPPIDPPQVLAIRPNPSRGDPTIALALSGTAPATLELVDISGRRVWSREVAPGAGRREVRIAGAGLAPGVYWVRLKQGGLTAESRVAFVR
jgi:hypothetical protein